MFGKNHLKTLELIGVEKSILPCTIGQIDRCCLLKSNSSQLSKRCEPFVKDVIDEDTYGRRDKRLGEGTYGVIFKTSHNFAIKCGKKKHEELRNSEIREVGVLRNLIHPNVILIHQVSLIKTADCSLRIVLPYFKFSLRSIIFATHKVPQHDRILFGYQLLRAVAFIHSKSVLHRDIKPDNILIDENQHLVLADFGLAQGCAVEGLKKTTNVVTVWYRAPELLLNDETYGNAVDVWACGATWLDMLNIDSLHSQNFETDQSGFEQLYRTFAFIEQPWEDARFLPRFALYSKYAASLETLKQKQLSREVKTAAQRLKDAKTNENEQNLIVQLLALNPTRRISAQSSLSYAVFDGVREQVENELPAQPFVDSFSSLVATQLAPLKDYLPTYNLTRESIEATLKYLYDLSVFRHDHWSLFALAASYFHRVLSANMEKTAKLTLQQIAIGCFMISSKMDSNSHEFNAEEAHEFDSATSESRYAAIEHDLLRSLDFDLDRPTCHSFWQITAFKPGKNQEMKRKSSQLLVSMLQSYDSIKYWAEELSNMSWA